MEALEGDVYVKKATVEFHASARVDDQLEVALKCSRIGTSSMVFMGEIFRGDDHLISCELIYVFADPATQTSKPVPIALCDILTGYEAWEPMVRVELGTWQALGSAARQVRTEVFLEEQRIPVEMEWDQADDTAVHALARNRLGLPVATGRLLQHAPGVGRIGRMAVNRVLRGSNLGRDVLRALMQAAADRGDREVLLHAQRNAEGFYARLGFLPRGEPFEEAGIVHIEMYHALPPGYQALVGTA
jgi:predicted GNAT family N-acyltransferase